MTLIGGALASTLTLLVLIPRITRKAKLFYERLATLAELGETLTRMDKKAEAANKHLDDQLANLIAIRRIQMDLDPSMMQFEMDPHGHLIWANRLWHSTTGLQRDEARGSGWEIAIARRSRVTFFREFRKMLDHQRSFDEEVSWVDREGQETTMKLSILPVRNKAGEILNFHGIGIVK